MEKLSIALVKLSTFYSKLIKPNLKVPNVPSDYVPFIYCILENNIFGYKKHTCPTSLVKRYLTYDFYITVNDKFTVYILNLTSLQLWGFLSLLQKSKQNLVI